MCCQKSFTCTICHLPRPYLPTGEAIWDKPEVVSGMEAHAKALELRYSGLPQTLLLKVLRFLPAMPDRMKAAAVCSPWLEGTRHKIFKLKVPALFAVIVAACCCLLPLLLYIFVDCLGSLSSGCRIDGRSVRFRAIPLRSVPLRSVT